MSPLRQRMIEEMKLAGLASATQAIYIAAVCSLAAYYRRSPDELSEEEVRAVSAVSLAAPSRSSTTAFDFCTARPSIVTGHCFQKKDPPALAEVFAQCPR